MKRSTSTSTSPPTSVRQKMAPGVTSRGSSSETRSTGSSLEGTSQFAHAQDTDYSSFMSDVMVVGAGPGGLMLAYVLLLCAPHVTF